MPAFTNAIEWQKPEIVLIGEVSTETENGLEGAADGAFLSS